MLKPTKKYSLNYTQKIHSETKYTGDTAYINKLRSAGIKDFSTSDNDLLVKSMMTTSEIINDSTFNVIINFQKANGTNDSILVTSGSKIYGHCFTNHLPFIDSVILIPSAKKANADIMDVFANSILQIDFPINKMKIGDVFYNTLPLMSDSKGQDPLRINIITGYKLVKVNKKVAIFEIKQVFKIKMGDSKLPGNVSGEGNGILVYDRIENFYKSYELDATMNYSIKFKHYTAETKTISMVKHENMITKK